MAKPEQWRKKSVVIEAIQWTGSNAVTLLDWIKPEARQEGAVIVIPTLEGDHEASLGDWIIKGVAGEFYPCKPDIFTMTYERASPAVTPAPTPHEYQPSLNPNDQGECVVCGGGPHTRIGAKPAPTLAEAAKVLADLLEQADDTHPQLEQAVQIAAVMRDAEQTDQLTAALRRIAEGGK